VADAVRKLTFGMNLSVDGYILRVQQGWMAAALLDAEKRFRRVKGLRDMPMLRVALHRHNQGLESTRRSA
jgi:hypothetical protein